MSNELNKVVQSKLKQEQFDWILLTSTYADPVSKTRKIYLEMDEAGEKTIVFDVHVTTLFDNHNRQSEMELDG